MKNYEDPTFNMPKEFFIYEYNEKANVCICTESQLGFIAKHYIEYYKTPINILIWLYDVASYAEDLLDEQVVYTGPKQKQKKRQDEEEKDLDDDGSFVKSKENQKKKLIEIPTFNGPVYKAMSEEDKKKKHELMNLLLKKEEEEEKNFKKEEKDVNQLLK